jgi:hypothetical protein
MPLVLGLGASRMCRGARLRVAWRTRARAGRHRWRAHGVAADDPSLGIRPSEWGWRPSALRRLGAARWARHDLLAHRHGEWMRPALEPFAMAACRDRPLHWWRCCSCPTGVSGRLLRECRTVHLRNGGTSSGGDRVLNVVRVLIISIGALLLWCGGSAADIGIVSMSAKTAQPGERVLLRAEGYLGPKPWGAYPIVLVSRAAEPNPYKCGTRAICGPTRLARAIRKPPFRVVGSVTHWHTLRGVSVNGWGLLVFHVPKMSPGVYVPMLVCMRCARGPRVSLIATRGLVLRIN